MNNSVRKLLVVLGVAAIAAVLVYVSSVKFRPGHARSEIASVDRLVRQFEQLALYREFSDGKREYPLEKWRFSIRVVLGGWKVDKYQPMAIAHVRTLTALTGLHISIARKSDGTENAVMFFGPVSRMLEFSKKYLPDAPNLEESIKEATCLANNPYTERHTIQRGYTYIGLDFGDAFVSHCVLHEMMHVLGFYGHSKLIDSSVLSDKSEPQDLTVNDRILLRTLYDSRMHAGMSRDRAMTAAREIIPALVDAVRNDGVQVLNQN